MSRKLTTKEIKERMYELVGSDYELLSEYVNAKTKVKIKHVACGNEYEVIWNSFRRGSRCPKCAVLAIKNKLAFTNEDIVKAMYKLVGDEYTKMDENYINSQTKFKIRHNNCGFEYETVWGSFQQGVRCPKCAGNINYTNEDIVQKMYDLVGNEYTKLDNSYSNVDTKFKIKHNKCGHEYEIAWNSFQRGVRCPKCAGKYRYTDNEISELVAEMTNGEYTKLSEYKNNKTKFKIKHNTCGHEYEVIWGHFKRGSRCPKCSGLMKLTNEEIVKRIYELVGDEYTKLDDSYKNASTKFKIKHNTCGHEYKVRWNDFKQGYRCPKCNQSKGEKFIADYLTNQHISFTPQIRFSDCKYKNTLPFDFAILDSEMRVKALIEFDGEQHYKSVEIWGGEEALKEVQLRDQIKNEYCKEHNLPLLRIRFDEDIEEKLNLFLNKLKGSKRE